MAKHTWSKFWWTDWQGDLALKSCSYAARGLWMDMLAIMHASDDEGHFTISGRKVSAKQLAGLSNGTEKEVAKLLIELEENGVYSVNEEGIIYSRRMVRDKAIREQAQRDGKLGGNPDLKAHKPNKVNPGGNGQDNGGVNPPHKASLKLLDTKKLEARSQIPEKEERSLRSPSSSDGFEAFWKSYPRKVGKGDAEKAFAKAIREASPEQLLEAVETYPFNPDDRYIPHASTWLNGKRWLDQHDTFDPVLRAAGLSPEDFELNPFSQQGLLN